VQKYGEESPPSLLRNKKDSKKYIRAMYDVIVIGSGLGGLFSSALVKQAFPSSSVLILEAHTAVGGCASYFDRSLRVEDGTKQRFRFDVGATTLSGIEEGQSVREVLDRLHLSLPVIRCQIGTHIVLNSGERIYRYADRDKWHDESARFFGIETIPFWQEVESLAKEAWSVSGKYPFFPFTSLRDVAKTTLNLKPAHLGIALKSNERLLSLLRKYHLHDNKKFISFLDEQLLISLQCKATEAPLLLSALALDYPSETYYVKGGMYTIAESVLERFTCLGGEISYKQLVTSISYSKEKKTFSLSTQQGKTYEARSIISNATIWDTASFLDDSLLNVKKYLERDIRRDVSIWGGLDLYGIIEDSINDNGALYHQIHGDGYSVFLSLSDKDDQLKAPSGYRVFSCSTHEKDPQDWFNLREDEYALRKKEALAKVEEPLHRHLDGYSSAKKLFLEFATPRSFEFYTRRMFGRVGGIPHASSRRLWQWRSSATPQKGFYMVGDTVFPGQGTPALAQGALNLLARLQQELP
jgi:C-3',4' desaturase CrtD